MMKRVGQRHGQYGNRSYRRTGALFAGRFRASLIEADGDLLACRCYLEQDPVCASMVSAPGNYPWSSDRAQRAGRERADDHAACAVPRAGGLRWAGAKVGSFSLGFS